MRLFAYRLAVMTGTLDVDVIFERLTVTQFAEWMAYYQVEPFSREHSDYLIAQLTALTRNINRQAGTEASKPQDYLPYHKPEQEDWQSMFDKLRRAKRGAI